MSGKLASGLAPAALTAWLCLAFEDGRGLRTFALCLTLVTVITALCALLERVGRDEDQG